MSWKCFAFTLLYFVFVFPFPAFSYTEKTCAQTQISDAFRFSSPWQTPVTVFDHLGIHCFLQMLAKSWHNAPQTINFDSPWLLPSFPNRSKCNQNGNKWRPGACTWKEVKRIIQKVLQRSLPRFPKSRYDHPQTINFDGPRPSKSIGKINRRMYRWGHRFFPQFSWIWTSKSIYLSFDSWCALSPKAKTCSENWALASTGAQFST